MQVLGIDIGGTGIKGAVVEVRHGRLVTERYRLLTPHPAKPARVATVVSRISEHFNWNGPIGCTFPGVVRDGVVCTAANVDRSWIDKNGRKMLEKRTGCYIALLNDADAAGMAEMRYGAGRGQKGLVMMLTFGTGIGSGVFFDGRLIPNIELGHIELRGKEAEDRVSDRVRRAKGWDWAEFAARLEEYLCYLQALFSPDLFIVGGGISKAHGKFIPLLHLDTPVVPARLLNEAGIVGAALAAYKREGE